MHDIIWSMMTDEEKHAALNGMKLIEGQHTGSYCDGGMKCEHGVMGIGPKVMIDRSPAPKKVKAKRKTKKKEDDK